MEQYEAGRLLAARGVIGAKDMTPEAAYTKLAWLLAAGGDVRARMQLNLRGELSPA
jgi:L-asparaginase/Glu-tRNA(Gln) amidotransferase subunit D